ncbi:hypothetical protein [Solimonas soli]|uniref:hypothetical protein n=1 Tax=Solimonas soli TaxID=413479 RepID=UPI0004B61105|nr:hypothetical protein [Solimonas soli]
MTTPAPLGSFRFSDVAMDAAGDFAATWSAAWIEYPSGPDGILYSRIDARLFGGP